MKEINDTASFVKAFGGADNSTEATAQTSPATLTTTTTRRSKVAKAPKKPARGGLAAAAKSTRATKPAKAAKAPKAPKAAKAAGKGKSDAKTAVPAHKHEPLSKDILALLAATPEDGKETLVEKDGQYTKSSHIKHLLTAGAKIAGKPLTVVDIVDVLDVKYPKNHRRRVLRRIRKVIAACEKKEVKISFVDVPNKQVV